jgi:poly(A) polymerase
MTALSPQHGFAVEIVRKLRAAGHIALFAGGCVRDALLGRQPKDYDVATTARPEEVRTLFGHRRTLAVGASFGVIMVVGPKDAGHVEVATFRTEGPYLDGRRPENVSFCTPEEDAKRRDFTINGMFFDPIEGRILDFIGGEADLSARLIRAIGDPYERVREDKLRMLRAVRFTATLNFSLDPITASAIREMSSELIVVSAERIAQELKKMLIDVHRRRAIELAEEVELVRVIFPELDEFRTQTRWIETLRCLELLEAPSFEIAMTVLLLPIVVPPLVELICRRLKLSNDESDRITWLVTHRSDLDNAPVLSMATLKRILSHPYCDDLLKLQQAERRAKSESLEPYEFCREFLARTPYDVINPVPLVTGDDLIAMGLKPGPRFKCVLEIIRDAQLNLELKTRDEALAMANSEWSKN